MPAWRAVLVQTAGTGYCALVSFALSIVLARTLPVQVFGLYGALTAAATLALIAIECGWPALVYRETAARSDRQVPADTLYANALAHAWLATAVAAILAAASVPFWPHGASLAVAMLCMGCVATANIVSGRLRGNGRFALESGWQAAARTASALAIAAAALLEQQSPAVLYAAWAAGAGGVIVLFGRRWLVAPDWSSLRTRYGLVLPLIAMEGTAALLLRGDLVLYGTFGSGGAWLSYYAACSRITEACLLMFAPFANVLLRSFRLRRNTAEFGGLLRRTTVLAILLGAVAWLACLLWGDALMPLLFGGRYADAGALLPWLATMLPFALVNLILFPAIIATGRELRLLRWVGYAAVIHLASVTAGTLLADAHGAALGATVANASLTALALRALADRPPPP